MVQCLYIKSWECEYPEDADLTQENCDGCLKARKTKAEIDVLLADAELIKGIQEEEEEEEEE